MEKASDSTMPMLFERVAEGDEVAFKRVYEFYFPKVQRFANRVLHDREYALEVAQEVMLAVWQKGERLHEVRNPEAFIKTLSKRRTIDRWRRLQTERAAEAEVRSRFEESNDETAEYVVRHETQQTLEEAILLLPPRQRTVFQLCQQQGLRYEDAAKQLNIAPTTVQTHMKLALRFLRTYLRKRIDLTIWACIVQFFA